MKKLYYSIGEVSKFVGVEPHVLRYWEQKFTQLAPSKNRAGKRVYTDEDLELICKLKSLIVDQKYSTAGARKALDESSQDKEQNELPASVVNDLQKVRVLLNDLLSRI